MTTRHYSGNKRDACVLTCNLSKLVKRYMPELVQLLKAYVIEEVEEPRWCVHMWLLVVDADGRSGGSSVLGRDCDTARGGERDPEGTDLHWLQGHLVSGDSHQRQRLVNNGEPLLRFFERYSGCKDMESRSCQCTLHSIARTMRRTRGVPLRSHILRDGLVTSESALLDVTL